MGLGRWNPGCTCCDTPPTVDIIVSDNNDDIMSRFSLSASGKTSVWAADSQTDFLAGSLFGGCNYAPSFDGEGVVSVYPSGGAGSNHIYEFDIDTGASLGSLATPVSGTPRIDDIYQESDGYVGLGTNTCRVMNTAGTSTVAGGAHSAGGDTPFCRRSNGDVWKVIAGNTNIFINGVATHDLSGDLVNATALRAIVSSDGIDFYVLATSATDVELFHVDTSGTATLLTTHSTASNIIRTFTKIGEYLFWCPLEDKVYRYSIGSDTLDLLIERTSGTWNMVNHSLGRSFFVRNN
jgi:uncharacterized Zn-binding protein involved in type VI secretion